jgi:hypothetical protein
MYKTRYQLHMFFKKITHHYFKSSPSICISRIDRVNFYHFRSSKIRVSPTSVVSSLSTFRCHISSGPRRHTAAPCHASFSWSQDEFAAFASSSGNTSSRRLPSRAKTKALNLHYRRRPPSPDRLTPTLHYYKKDISTLITFLTTQLSLYFASSLARAPRYQSSTRCHRFFTIIPRPSSLCTTIPTITN